VTAAGPAVRIERAGRTPDLLALADALPGPASLYTVRGWTVVLGEPLDTLHELAALSDAADRIGWRDARDPALPPFTGGLAGYLTDELSRGLLALPPRPARPAPAPLPALAFGVHDTALCADPDGTLWLVAADLPGWSRRPPGERIDALRRLVADAPAPPAGTAPPPTTAAASLDRAAHAAAVAQAREWIAAGDLYQLNLTLQVRAAWTGGGAALARRLWDASPGAAHAAWLRAGAGVEIVSASPETFLRTDAGQVAVRPIKGTAARSGDARDDAAAADALRHSPKDAAEHVMIVDLERNDLGRVAVHGSVRVPEFAALEGHPTVWHLTSTVTAALRPDVTLGNLLAATFPCGSVTGAPKRMAVDRIDDLEPTARGVYCGAIGVVSRGLVDLSVAIRTAVVHDGVAHYGTGGGIVADSRPDDEWQEVLHKAEAFFAAANTRLPQP